MLTPLVAGLFALAGVSLGVFLEPVKAKVAAGPLVARDRLPLEPEVLLGCASEHLVVALEVVLEQDPDMGPHDLPGLESQVPLRLELDEDVVTEDPHDGHRREGPGGSGRVRVVELRHERMMVTTGTPPGSGS